MRVEAVGPVVVDTNIWISAFLSRTGVPAALVRHLLAHAQPVFSPATFEELKTRLWRPKFDRYLSMDERKLLLHDLDAVARWAGWGQVLPFAPPLHFRPPERAE